jgi:hypothetical protein
MKRLAVSPYEKHAIGCHESRAGQISNTSGLRRRHFRLSPVMAIGIAAAGLALGVGLETGHFSFHLGAEKTLSLEEGVDISLRLLMRARVIGRLEREGRLNNTQARNLATVENELQRLRKHPLYVTIKEMSTAQLRTEGYDRIHLTATGDSIDTTLSFAALTALHRFISSLRASFPATNETFVSFLNDEEEANGESVVVHSGAGPYDATLAVMIQLVCEFPNDLEPVASSVTFHPIPAEEIERRVRGIAQDLR